MMANERARALRKAMTPAERMLWQKLREMKTRGFHFRKQAPIGRFIADFCCHSAKLIIEVDGGQHANDADRVNDARRTDWLVTQGYRVLRFWNNEVLGNIEGVVATIAAEFTPTPTPPHTGEGQVKH
ncbi:MAG: endonuclease domain-containing protein [Rhodospirillaceae bacterium]|nr:endonuclease domain-containing protein [Rhodospirillaceae bacterium]